ncbi:hypothetical protein AMECASPLE_006785 [Ameca splendens]|uniref:Secreted protein n=1 Tax=Ameca splendens TaxID=208324 RepID=A0ABV0YAP9_9TELE
METGVFVALLVWALQHTDEMCEQAVLVQTLAAKAWVALGAAEQVSVRVVAVAHHPPTHHLASLRVEHNENISTQGLFIKTQGPYLKSHMKFFTCQQCIDVAV